MADRRRPVLLLIDVEPDGRRLGNNSTWSGTHTALELLEKLRLELGGRTGVPARLNWFLRMDPQIKQACGHADWIARSIPGLIETVSRHEDGVGIHPHMWKWDEIRRQWYNEFDDLRWLEHCLRLSMDTFSAIFGSPPVMCRFGDRWLTEDCVRLEAAMGIRYDLTVEPGMPDMPLFDDPFATSWLPDYSNAPRDPYRPREGNFLEPGGGSGQPWIIPVTTTTPALRLIRRPPYLMQSSYSPNLALAPRMIGPHLDREFARDTHVPLVIVLRSGDLAAPGFRANFDRNAARLIDQKGLARCEFTGPPAAITG